MNIDPCALYCWDHFGVGPARVPLYSYWPALGLQWLCPYQGGGCIPGPRYLVPVCWIYIRWLDILGALSSGIWFCGGLHFDTGVAHDDRNTTSLYIDGSLVVTKVGLGSGKTGSKSFSCMGWIINTWYRLCMYVEWRVLWTWSSWELETDNIMTADNCYCVEHIQSATDNDFPPS